MREFYYLFLSVFHPPIRWIYKKRLRVLACHGIPNKKAFSKQIKYLKNKYHLISISELEEYLEEKKKLPSYSLFIDF